VNSSEINPCPAVHPAAPVTRSERDPESGGITLPPGGGVGDVVESVIEDAAVEEIVGVPVGSPEVSVTAISVQP
jgi:hypothetical protein